MQHSSPLDAPLSDPKRLKPSRATRIAFILEIFLWAARILSAIFILESWELGSELFIISTGLLALLYFTVPYLVLGSRDRWQRILSYGVGFSLGIAMLLRVLHFANWPGVTELSWVALILVPLVGLGLFVSLLKKPASWREGTFFKHALLRWGLAAWLVYGGLLLQLLR